MEKNLLIHERAEFFTPQELDTIELIGFGSELKSLVEEISKLPSHEVFTIYIEGQYGSGKTLFIRKLLHELFKKNEKIIPFHIFIGGETSFRPFKSIEGISLKIKEFVEIGKTSPVIVGNREGWKNRLEIIKKAIEQSKEQFITPKLTDTAKKTQDQQQLKEQSRAEMQAFENFLKYIIKEGYIPVIIFDETERIFTGEAVLGGDDAMNFSYLLNEWHAFSRGHKMTPLVLGISTTFSYNKLIESYKGNPQLQLISQYSGMDFIKDTSLFPLIPSFKTYYNKVLIMKWDPDTLKKLGRLIIGGNEGDPRIKLLDELSSILLLTEYNSKTAITQKSLQRYKKVKIYFETLRGVLNILNLIPHYSPVGFSEKDLKPIAGIKSKKEYYGLALKFLPYLKVKKESIIFDQIISLFRSFGIIDTRYVGGKEKGIVINLTMLGETVRNSLMKFELREDYALAIYFISGLLFKTKARTIALAALNYTKADLKTIYNELYLRLGKFPEIEKGIEEILDEVQLSNAGEYFLTDTQLVLAVLDFLGLINLINKREYERSKEGNFITPSVFMGIDFVLNGVDTMGIIQDRNYVGYTPFSNYISEPYKYGKHSGKKLAIAFAKALENVLNELKEKSYQISIDLHRRFGRLQKM